MTPLEQHLADLIENQGPISVAAFMSVVLGHPTLGYYSAQRPFGQDGDFTTAPEISQVFGELLGLWCVQTWMDLGQPAPFDLVELGPGRGVLMSDALRAIQQVAPSFVDSVNVRLVEISPSLRDEQKGRLSDHVPWRVTWHNHFSEIDPAPCIVIGNEFFDALPIHQYTKLERGWGERLVGLTGNDAAPFEFRVSPALGESAPDNPGQARIGDVFEASPASHAVIAEIAERLVAQGGAALFVDYGYDAPGFGDTLQAVKNHRHHPVLSEIGLADVTAHVNFAALMKSAQSAGAFAWGAVDQGVFLERLGIHQRAHALMGAKDDKTKQMIKSGVDRLTGDAKMGRLFKVISICGAASLHPAGFGKAEFYGGDHQSNDT